MEPRRTDRPHMPGYGVEAATDGLLDWSWAVDRLGASRAYWVATTRPDGRAHVMPVWAVWREGALWFSAGLGSRKARNLARDDRCSITTDDTHRPVVIEGRAMRTTDPDDISAFAAAVNVKYAVAYPDSFYDPSVNGVFAVRPAVAIGLDDAAFTTSPTRWTFADR